MKCHACRQGITSGGQGSVFVIASVYGLDGPGFEPRLGVGDFLLSISVQTSPGTHLISTITTVGSFPAVNQPRRGVNRPPESSAGANSECGYGCTPPVCLVRRVMD